MAGREVLVSMSFFLWFAKDATDARGKRVFVVFGFSSS
jgi:hypothetical protein